MMNALEKAKLIKELQDLGQDLDHRALSLFDVARSKKRVRDIFELCNEPIFKKQNLAFKTLTQPDVAAYEFAADSLYKLSFRGFFLDEYDLEKALYQYPESGWAFLYHSKKGWQIWLIPAANRTALISEWTDIEQSYAWLLHQQTLSTCLKTDLELKATAAILSLSDAEIQLKPATIIESQIEKNDLESEKPAQISISKDKKTAKMKTPKSKSNKTSLEESPQESTVSAVEMNETISPKPRPIDDFKLGEWAIEVIDFKNSEQFAEALYELKLQDQTHSTAFLQIILNHHDQSDVLNQPIYLAEQLESSGQFKSYLMLIGATSAEHAQVLIQHLAQTQTIQVAAIKASTWQDLRNNIFQLEQLYTFYSQITAPLWQQDIYYPYIPTEIFSPRKYMLFDESIPHTNTPILLLEERQKLRVIHGEKRINMHKNELAYPCIILNRDKKLNWQSIHSLIAEMPKPIAVDELYLALKSQMTE